MRSGRDYIQRLQKTLRDVWINGEKVTDVVSHPALSNSVKAIAALYDLQLQRAEEFSAAASTGERVPYPLLIPKNIRDLNLRGQAFYKLAGFSGGFLGRAPDYLNSILSSWAGAADFFGAGKAD